MSDLNDIESRGAGSGSYTDGSTGDCPNGHIVFKWNSNSGVFEKESGSCSGSEPSAPVPSSSQIATIETYDEFRTIACCSSN